VKVFRIMQAATGAILWIGAGARSVEGPGRDGPCGRPPRPHRHPRPSPGRGPPRRGAGDL